MTPKTINIEMNKDLDIEFLLNSPLLELVSYADKIRKDAVGRGFELCNIINAKSGLCSEDCKFCAQSTRHSCEIPTYPLKEKEQIVEAARQARETGAEKFGIVTSGNRLNEKELDIIARAIAVIKSEVGIMVCGSLGALDRSELARLKNAGLTCYHRDLGSFLPPHRLNP